MLYFGKFIALARQNSPPSPSDVSNGTFGASFAVGFLSVILK